MKFKRSSFGIVFNTLFSFVFSLLLTLYINYTQGMFTFNEICMGLVPAFAINFTLGSYIPLVKVGNAFAHLFSKNENGIVFYFLRMFMIVLIMTFSMSLLVMFSQMGFTMDLIFALVFSFPGTFLYAYICGLIVFPFLFKATMSMCCIEG